MEQQISLGNPKEELKTLCLCLIFIPQNLGVGDHPLRLILLP